MAGGSAAAVRGAALASEIARPGAVMPCILSVDLPNAWLHKSTAGTGHMLMKGRSLPSQSETQEAVVAVKEAACQSAFSLRPHQGPKRSPVPLNKVCTPSGLRI